MPPRWNLPAAGALPARCLSLGLLLTLMLLRPGFAQFVLQPAEVVREINQGEVAESVILSVENTTGIDRSFSAAPGVAGIANTTEEIFIVFANETVPVEVTFDTSQLEPGFYSDSITFTEQPIGRQVAQEFRADFFIEVFATGPPVVTNIFFEASPAYILETGIGIDEGEFFAILVEVSGSRPLSYLWEYSADGSAWESLDGQPGVIGALTSVLEIPQVTPNNQGLYRCTITNSIDSAFSPEFLLEVVAIATPTPTLSTTPTPTPVVTTTAPGTPTPTETPTPIPTTVTPTPEPTIVTPTQSPTPTPLITPATPTVAVIDITLQPESVAVLAGEAAFFSVEAFTIGPIEYSWEFSIDGVVFGELPATDAEVEGADTQDLAIRGVTAGDAGFYRCKLFSINNSVFSDVVQLSVIPEPPFLELAPARIQHFVVDGQPFAPATLLLRNLGGTPLNFQFGAPEESWLGLANPSSGSLAPGNERRIEFPISSGALALDDAVEALVLLETNALGSESVLIPLTLSVVDPFTVTTLADNGPGSLRSQIIAANVTAGPQTIRFAVAGTIQPESALPAVQDATGGTTIDGGGVAIIDGSQLRGLENGLEVRSAGNLVTDLTIVGFPANGILVHGPAARDNRITLCRIGTNGTTDIGNGQSGIRLDGGSSGTIVGGSSEFGNTISGNAFSAVSIGDSFDNVVSGNRIGTGASASGLIDNGGHGVHILPIAPGRNTIGGGDFFDANTIGGIGFFPGNVDVLVGSTVRLKALVHGTEALTFQWFREGNDTPVGNDQTLVIENIQPSQEGLYFALSSNASGSAESKRTYVNVLPRQEFAALLILPDIPTLDSNADGGLSYNEIATVVTRAFSRAARGSGGLTLAEFNAMDLDDDGLLSIPEILVAADIPLDEVRYEVTPPNHAYPGRDIDDGPAGENTFIVTNLTTTPLDLFTTPSLGGVAAAEFQVTDGTGSELLPFAGERTYTVTSDPQLLNERVAYLMIRTDDFLLPEFPVLLSGFGTQDTGELLRSLLHRGTGRSIGELDVNADTRFDGSDIEANLNNGR